MHCYILGVTGLVQRYLESGKGVIQDMHGCPRVLLYVGHCYCTTHDRVSLVHSQETCSHSLYIGEHTVAY